MSSLKRKASCPSPLNVGHMYPSMAGGFGLVEILVGMAILGMVTVALVTIMGNQRESQLRSTLSIKAIQDQRFLERAIWAQYDGLAGALPACNILVTSPISLDASNTCVSGSNGPVWAEAKRLSDSGCTFNGFSSRQLTLSGCTTPGTLRDNINGLAKKSEFKVAMWSNTVEHTLCILEDTSMPASVSGSNLVLQLSSTCAPALPSSSDSNVRVRIPHFSVTFFRRASSRVVHDGYERFYYRQD